MAIVEFAEVSTARDSTITASSTKNIDGSVQIDAPDTEISRGDFDGADFLSERRESVERAIRGTPAKNVSSFVVIGRMELRWHQTRVH